MARSVAPELVTADDILEDDLDSTPIDARGRAVLVDLEEARRADATITGTYGRPWELWKRKALGK